MGLPDDPARRPASRAQQICMQMWWGFLNFSLAERGWVGGGIGKYKIGTDLDLREAFYVDWRDDNSTDWIFIAWLWN